MSALLPAATGREHGGRDAATGERLLAGRLGQVLAGMWEGKGTKEIAADLGISSKTVEFHRERLYRVFGVHNPVSLCRRAMEVGVIKPETDFTAKNSESAEIFNHPPSPGYGAAGG